MLFFQKKFHQTPTREGGPHILMEVSSMGNTIFLREARHARSSRMGSFLCASLLVCSAAFGAEPQQAADPSYIELLRQGGLVMYPLFALSFLAACLIFYNLMVMRIEVLVPSSLVAKVDEAVRKSDLELAEGACAQDASVGARIIEAGVKSARNSGTPEAVEAAIDEEGGRQSSLLWQKIQYLQDIVVVAPMLGLLGTVFGMIKCFLGLQVESMIPKQTLVTKGIAMAFVCTATGLVIAISVMVVYSYFRGHLTRLIPEIERRCGTALKGLSSQKK